MPAFQLAPDQVADIATFLHAAIFLNANRRLYQVLDIVTGDPKAGEAYFSGAGKCTTCHSPTGDLKGVGAKYDAVTLQGRVLMPRGGRGAGPPQPAYLDKNAIRVTVTLPSRQTISGVLVRLTDFDVTLYDPQTGQIRSWFRNGDAPKVEISRSAAGPPRSIAGVDRRRHAQHDGLSGRSQVMSTRALIRIVRRRGAAGAGRARRTTGRGARSNDVAQGADRLLADVSRRLLRAPLQPAHADQRRQREEPAAGLGLPAEHVAGVRADRRAKAPTCLRPRPTGSAPRRSSPRR